MNTIDVLKELQELKDRIKWLRDYASPKCKMALNDSLPYIENAISFRLEEEQSESEG